MEEDIRTARHIAAAEPDGGTTFVEPAKPSPRRGRPPVADKTATTAGEAAQPAKRRRRASVGGHAMKLSAPAKPGHTRHWFNDIRNRIAEAHELGYDHVTEQGIKTDGPGSRVSRLVGTKPNGEPLHAFLMETPDELYAEGIAEKEAHNRQIDEAISAGSPTDTPIGPASETYGEGSIKRDR